jgi:hypothetical protein
VRFDVITEINIEVSFPGVGATVLEEHAASIFRVMQTA